MRMHQRETGWDQGWRLLGCAVAMVLAWGCGEEETGEETKVGQLCAVEGFEDAGLEAAVRQATGQRTGCLEQAELAGLRVLSARERGISSLRGLEQLTSLERLDVSWNRIGDLSPISALTQLKTLDVSWNDVDDLTPLANLTRLATLDVSWNDLNDLDDALLLGPHSSLASLTAVGCGVAELGDCLEGLPSLARADFSHNPLRLEAVDDGRIETLLLDAIGP